LKEDARLAYSSFVTTGYDQRHEELLASLAHITRPRLEVEAVTQTRHEFNCTKQQLSARLRRAQEGSCEDQTARKHLLPA